jgi:hypothetical protein
MAAIVAIVAVGVPAAAQFVPGIAPIPILEGLAPDAEGPLVFDTPQGRIVATSLSGTRSEKAVRAFYGATLPQLGWRKLSEGQFRREGENLTLAITRLPGKRIRLRFRVAPVPGGPP